MRKFLSMLSIYIPCSQLRYNLLKTRYHGGFCADRPDDADGRQLRFTFGLSRRRRLYTKNTIFFSEHPIVHARNLTINKSSARAEGPTIVLRTEKVTGVSIMLTPVT